MLFRSVRAETDRRQNWLRITRAGKVALQKMLDFVARHEKKIGARLTASDRAQLLELLRKIG